MKLIIGVGLGKAASTSINNYLKKHPEIIICSPKEIYHKYLSESGLDINNLNSNFNFNKPSENFKVVFSFSKLSLEVLETLLVTVYTIIMTLQIILME